MSDSIKLPNLGPVFNFPAIPVPLGIVVEVDGEDVFSSLFTLGIDSKEEAYGLILRPGQKPSVALTNPHSMDCQVTVWNNDQLIYEPRMVSQGQVVGAGAEDLSPFRIDGWYVGSVTFAFLPQRNEADFEVERHSLRRTLTQAFRAAGALDPRSAMEKTIDDLFGPDQDFSYRRTIHYMNDHYKAHLSGMQSLRERELGT